MWYRFTVVLGLNDQFFNKNKKAGHSGMASCHCYSRFIKQVLLWTRTVVITQSRYYMTRSLHKGLGFG